MAPLSDRCSTFGFIKWTKAATKAGLRPIYGVELAVVPELGAAKPITDYCRFLAIDSITPLNELIGIATANPGKEPSLLYKEALDTPGLIKIFGERARLEHLRAEPYVFVGLSPAVSKGHYNAVNRAGISWIKIDSNFYPRESDQELYRIMLGRRAETRTYPGHILSDDEWLRAVSHVASSDDIYTSIENRATILNRCVAQLRKAEIFIPEKPKTLREMCLEGAQRLGIDLSNEVYSQRLDRELSMIASKNFEDYFYIIADLIAFAKSVMIVGPARGSSCGSLVCYLLNITTIDPIPYGLIFERFIDVNRSDLPDIDIDFSDVNRHLVFEYAEQKYGRDHVARLGTVSQFQPTSAMNQAGAALRIPKFKIQKTLEGVIERSSGDSRANNSLEDTLKETPNGIALLKEFPEVLIAARMEGHPNNAGQHAAGIVITKDKVVDVVAIDSRTGATMCDKYDAEEFGLLKIDALGLTQLSVQERTLDLIGETPTSDGGFLDRIPLDDPLAFEVINNERWAGIFQYTGSALQSLAKQFRSDNIEDINSVTALARPGPLASGGANEWVKRRNGDNPVVYPHPAFEPQLSNSLGIVIYQEQVMQIGRDIGDLSWEDVTLLRKAMSKSLGKEYFDQFGDRWKSAAVKKGIPQSTLDKVWQDLCAYGAWCLSGDTVLINPFPNQSHKAKTITLKQLFESKGHFNQQQKGRKQKIYCLQFGTIKPASIVDVSYSGERETWEVEVDSGEKIRATMEHRFLCSDMRYRRLKEIKSGMSVMLMGSKEPTKRKAKIGTGSGGHNWWSKFKAGLPLYKRQVEKLKRIYTRCQECKKRPYQETHHISMDHEDHSWENLLPVCRKCHRRLHGVSIGHSKGKMPRSAVVVSISNPMIEDAYDISMPDPHNNFVANGFVVHNSFNRSHAVAYGKISYQCCWLKAHYPLEFAAATLDAESDPAKQLAFLRELKEEGIDYVPVDPEHSTDRWSPIKKDNSAFLVGPLSAIKGVGPKTVDAIMVSRKSGIPLSAKLVKKLSNARTSLDSLYPITDRFKELVPDPAAVGIKAPIVPIKSIACGMEGFVIVAAVATRIAPRDDNDLASIAKRGYKLTGPSMALNMFFRDDSDEIFCRIDRLKYEKLAQPIIERGRAGKAMYALIGTVPRDFRMIKVNDILYLGEVT